MIVRSGLPATHEVLFESGLPAGNVSWQLLDAAGGSVASGTLTPAAEEISAVISLSGTHLTNTSGAFLGYRTLQWWYAVASGHTVSGELSLTIETLPPLGISAEGVRQKLGVTKSELGDDSVELGFAFSQFVSDAGPSWDSLVLDDELGRLVKDAVEALAALRLLPTMPVRIAAAETSGTSEFRRQNIDWTNLAPGLDAKYQRGLNAVDPTRSVASSGSLFFLAQPDTDPITGA